MTDELKIYCKNTEEYVPVAGGATVQSIYETLKDKIHFQPICALVNNRCEDLCYRVYEPRQVEFLDSTTASGQMIYTRSLCMVLYKAISDLYPGKRLFMQHSIGGGYYCSFKHEHEKVGEDVVAALKQRMQEIIAANMPFERHEALTTDVVELFRKQGLNDKVRLLETSNKLFSVYYSLGETIDSYFGPMAPNTGMLSVFNLVTYQNGMMLLCSDKQTPSQPAQSKVMPKLFKAFEEYEEFNDVLRISDVGELNQAIKSDYASMLINVAEAMHARMFSRIAEQIAERFRNGGARVVLIAGPSSSGKTTSSKRLATQLVTNYIRPKVISLDNYYVNRTETPLDEDGKLDYESLYALDLEQLNTDIARLIAGEEVPMPTYNFETGKREYHKGDVLKLEPDEVLVMEGIHGLNPELTKQIPEEQKFRVYVSALTTLNIDDHNWISTSDNRLLRRIVRDAKYRGTSPQSTIARWPSVRRGEEKWIFPYQENADAMFNSSMLFELAVMKSYAEPVLQQVPSNAPEFAEAHRLLRLLSYFNPLSEKDIPSTSLLREFLGGSSFHY